MEKKKNHLLFWILFPVCWAVITALLIFYFDLANGPLIWFILELVLLVVFFVVRVLLKEKKNLRKEQIKQTVDPNQKSLDNLSVWIIVYGIAVGLLCSPLLSNIWVKFAQLIIEAASDTIGAMDPSTVLGKIVVVLLVFALPLLLHVISWVLYLNAVKSKTDKFAFRIAWIIQALVTIITMTIAIINVLKG